MEIGVLNACCPHYKSRLRTNVKCLLNFCLFNSACYYGLVLERSHRQSIMQKRLVKPTLIFLAPLFVCLFVFFSFSVLLRKHPDFEAKTQCLSTLAGVSTVQFVVHYCSQHHRYQLKKNIIMIMIFCRSWKVIQTMKLDSDL